MRAIFAVAVAALACVALADELSFKAGVNLTHADTDFSFRYTGEAHIDIPAVVDLLAWSSLSVDASGNGTSGQTSANAMIGAGVLPTALTPPFALLAYACGQVKFDLSDLFTKFFVGGNIDVMWKAGVAGMAAFGMQELDKSNKAVGAFIPFIGAFCKDQSINGDNGNLTGLYCTLNAANGAKVRTTYITSKKAGIIEYGNTPVSSRTYEMIIEVTDFPLTDEKNHVRMEVGFLNAKGKGSLSGAVNVIKAEGDRKDNIYVAARTSAIIDGSSAKVEVSVDTNLDDVVRAYLTLVEKTLSALLGGDMEAYIAHVDFPAGKKNFIYDPVIGSGAIIYEAAGASTVALSLLVALVCALVYLF